MRQSAISYFADIVACPVLSAGLAIFAFLHFPARALIACALMTVLGAVLWTLVEYVMHRVIYHRFVVFRRFHEAHHDEPRAYVGAPPLVGTGIVFLVSFVPLAAFAVPLAIGLSAGMLAGYAVYMLVHHAIHFRTPRPGGYLYRARLHHAVHHYRDDNGNFGVSTAFWDRVFSTLIQPASAASPVAVGEGL
jgi:sterol desaturase/sphingolipid hydroxylase (fatty acid hydroxylase superfamily)